jgi:hypothetical protein
VCLRALAMAQFGFGERESSSSLCTEFKWQARLRSLWFGSKDTFNSIFNVGTLVVRTWPMVRAHRDIGALAGAWIVHKLLRTCTLKHA